MVPIEIHYELEGRVETITQGSRTSLNQYFSSGAAAGYLQSATDALSQTTTFTRDALGRA